MNGNWHRIFVGGVFLILLLPLLNIPPLFSPPAWGQTIAFRLVFIPLFLFLLWQLLKTRALSLFIPHGPAKLPWVLLYALGGVLLIATFFSADPLHSFWDDPSRAWGAVNYLLYIAFAVVLFLVLKTKEWQRLWYVLLGTGVGLSLLAAFQNFGLFGGTLISYGRPVATLGNPIFLAMALVPLTILAMVWFSRERGMKRAALGTALLLFLYALFLTLSRAGFLGLGAGTIFLLLFAPRTRNKLAKTAILGMILAGVLLVWYATMHPTLPEVLRPLPESETLWRRLSLERSLEDPRFSAWGIALKATAQKPILGYGPYNASIALDKFYDSSISELRSAIGWWDTSHNIYVDFLVETGVVGLGVFLAFLASLFWKLQQLRRKKPELHFHITGVQAAFVGYLVNGMFSFNTFATYLVFFFLVAYSFHLISTGIGINQPSQGPKLNYPRKSVFSSAAIGVLAIASAWFLWQHNLAPLWVNKEMNVAVFQAQQGRCQQAIQKAEGLSSPSPQLNYYLPAQYTNVIRACLPSGAKDAQTRVALSVKAAELLDKAASARPHYSRPHLTKVDYLNIVLTYIEEGEQKEAIVRETEAALQRAQELSPEREDLRKKWSVTARLQGKYAEAVEQAEKCLALNPGAHDCLWEKVLANILRGDLQAADKDFEELVEQRFLPIARLNQLALTYQTIGNYERLATTYEQLISTTENPQTIAQYAGSLALTRKQLGNWRQAHEATLIILKHQPKLRGQVEEFLQSIGANLRQECGGNASSCWRLSLVELTLGNQQEALLARAKAEELGFPISSEQALRNLVDVYDANQDIPSLIDAYQKIAELSQQQGEEEKARMFEERVQELMNKFPQ